MDNTPLEMMTRRSAFLGMGAFAFALPLQGCALFLLRLFVSRGASRALVSAGRIGRTSAALTFGRGISVGSRIGRIQSGSLGSLPPTNVIDPKGRLVAESRTVANGVSVYVDQANVFHSITQPYGYRHYDSNGPAGHSHNEKGGTIVHKNEQGLVTAVDRIMRANKVIQHMDDNGRVIGQTSFKQSGTGIELHADDGTLAHIEALKRDLGLQCPDANRAREQLLTMQNKCLSNDGPSCRELPYQRQKYDLLRARCLSNF